MVATASAVNVSNEVVIGRAQAGKGANTSMIGS